LDEAKAEANFTGGEMRRKLRLGQTCRPTAAFCFVHQNFKFLCTLCLRQCGIYVLPFKCKREQTNDLNSYCRYILCPFFQNISTRWIILLLGIVCQIRIGHNLQEKLFFFTNFTVIKTQSLHKRTKTSCVVLNTIVKTECCQCSWQKSKK